jgi:hypothetical protein
VRGISAFAAAVVLLASPAAAAAEQPSSTARTARFCDAYRAFNVFYSSQYLDGNPTPEQVRLAQPRFDRLADALDRDAPRSIDAFVATVTDAFRAGGAIAIDPTVSRAFGAVDRWAITHCDYTVLDVVAREFSFDGVPRKLAPGFVAFDVRNQGTQDHMLAVVRPKGGVTLAQLAAVSPEQALDQVDVIAPGVFAAAGKRVANFAQLTRPGHYAVVDPDHLADRMYAEFVVTRK